MKRTGIIYIATSKTSGKSYIGRDVNYNERKKGHKRSAFNIKSNAYNTHFCCAIRKYGFNDFEWKILYKCIPENQLNLAEVCAIYTHDTFYSGYNSTIGGEGCVGYKHTLRSIEKMSKPRTIEARKNMSESQKGKKHSAKTKAKMSKAHSGRVISLEHRKKISKSNSKAYKIIKPNGEIEIIVNLSKYCLKNNLSKGHMSSVAKNKRKQHKGYKCKYYEK